RDGVSSGDFALALENLRILEEEGIVDRVRDETGPYLKERFESLADHPLVGEVKIVGMMGSLALTPHKVTRAPFAEPGTAGLICRERCFANNLIMRHVYDRMVISPPLVISKDEIDTLVERARKSLDEALEQLKAEGHMGVPAE
ncbi:MAG: aminotransferase class III-fold pyridoxal phosphate-dependent enzyme, partial [Mameliella sp.]|nr:aminotransferase class III-fold pyridoxal phosphate-dependent enzyme [Mameliella sp.]